MACIVVLAATMITSGSAPAASAYPKINLAVGYEVDPTWPDQTPAYRWRYVTGVAVDKKDRVWVINAVDPQVRVYSTDGKHLFAWGNGTFKNPHHIVIDRNGNAWITDYGRHVVRKFTEKGNLYLGDVADNSKSHRVQKFLRLPPDR